MYSCKAQMQSHHLVIQSSTAFVRAWPRWSDPVTFGGGIHIMNKPRGLGSRRLLRCSNNKNNKKSFIARVFYDIS